MLDKQAIKEQMEIYLEHTLHTDFDHATAAEMYKAVATVVNAELINRRVRFNRLKSRLEKNNPEVKKVCYICMEFLMGQSLKNNLYNLGMTEMISDIVSERWMTTQDLFNEEPDAGLGNGGLGRLAACFMDALTTLGYDATGYSLLYEYGLFKQKIIDGWQAELPDNWLPGGRVWLDAHPDDSFLVSFYGDYKEEWTWEGMKYSLKNQQVVEAVPYEMYISGADTSAVNVLRLWKARDYEGFDMAAFNSGDFTMAAQRNNRAETITRVLYPADNIEEGKELRLKQQYFMVSASCQNIVRNQFRLYGTLDNFHEKTVIHINDTHPALVVPELMRIFMDDYGCSWDYAWERVRNSVSYTNHTILAEALEKWNEGLVRSMLPRVYSILREIDKRFKAELNMAYPGDRDKVSHLLVLGDGQVRMANLSVLGSHKVNGVSALHSDIIRDDLFRDYSAYTPEKFTNVTNGIAYRRWLCQSNPELSGLITECIGPSFKLHAERLADFADFKADPTVLDALNNIKRTNKARLSDMALRTQGARLDPDSVFIVQAKRLHEYKRQLLNVLRIIQRYQMLKDNPNMDIRPETYLFAAKAAPSYFHAKEIIRLICKLAEEIDRDPAVAGKLKVVFLENYGVTIAEHLLPSAEVSEQISLAGKEASGTGNMKMMINGAITVGTLDGANIEIKEAVGDDNIFIFGQTTEQVRNNLAAGYNARHLYETDDIIRSVVDRLGHGFAGMSFESIKDYLLRGTYSIADPYMCLMDFRDYMRAHDEITAAYEDRRRWNAMSVVNVAGAARFAADRSIKDYAEYVWNTKQVIRR